MRVLIPDQVASDWRDPNAEIALITLILPDEWAGWKVEELEADGHRRVVGITRTGHARIVGPQTTLQEGDQVHLAVDDDGLQELRPRVLAARRGQQPEQAAEPPEGSEEPRRGAPVGREARR
jgi:Trk K+ transport system NAD-binding subunit